MKKVKLISQLTLGVGLKDEATFANFYAGKNTQLVAALTKSAHGDGEHFLYFYGTGGLGCTHLLQACCHEAARHDRRAVYIPLANIHDFTPAIFDGLENLDLICVDDIHRLAGKPEWEEAFFHFYNRMVDTESHLIVTANVAPKGLALVMPDVTSRLASGVIFQIQALTDDEKLQVIMMRAERRGLTLSEEVGKFMLNHCPRHMSTLFAALDAIDKMSLAAQRKLTIPFIKTVLQI